MNAKNKLYVSIVLVIAVVVGWYLFKKTIVSMLTTAFMGALILFALYLALRFWWWRRKKRRGF